MSNNLLTDQHITNEALMILENELSFTKNVNRQYQKEYKGPTKRGATVYAKKPPRYTVRDGQNTSIQDTVITQVPVTLNRQFGVDVEFTSQDLTLSIEGFSEQVLKPQIVTIANAIDAAGLALALQVPNAVGTVGTTPGSGMTAQQTMQLLTKAQAYLDKNAAPRDNNRAFVMNEDAQAYIVPAFSGLFQNAKSIGDQYTNGELGRVAGLKCSMSQNVQTLTTGSQAGIAGATVNGTVTAATAPNGTTLGSLSTFNVPVHGLTAGATIAAGEVVTFAGCYLSNPVSHATTPTLKPFAVASAFTADGTGAGTLVVTELMITSGAFQNVSAVPASGAAVSLLTAGANTVSPQNLAFHRDAFTLACVDLPLPKGVHMAARKADDQLGLSLRFVAAYNISTDQFIGRFDILCGWASLRPEWGCRILG